MSWNCLQWTPQHRRKATAQRRANGRMRKIQENRERALTRAAINAQKQKERVQGYTQCERKCKKCGQLWHLTDAESQWYSARGLQEPTRCEGCRRGGSTSKARRARKV